MEVEVKAEDPNVVIGGPLDPTTEGGIAPSTEAPAAPAGSQAFYKGLTGEIKTAEELRTYTKNLEDLLVQSKASTITSPVPAAPLTPAVPQGPSAKERFSELIFSKPEEAFEIAVSEAESRINHKNNAASEAERQKKLFWENFYTKNEDLKSVKDTVELILAAKNHQVSQFKTNDEVETFLAGETRKQIDFVRKQTGYKESVVPSGSAVSLGGSREPVPAVPSAPPQSKNFAQQIRMVRPKGQTKR